MSRWSIFWYFTGNFWSKRRKSRWRSVRRPYWISDKKLSGFRILVQRPSNTPKIIKIGQPCLWTNLQILHGFLVDTLVNGNTTRLIPSQPSREPVWFIHKTFPPIFVMLQYPSSWRAATSVSGNLQALFSRSTIVTSLMCTIAQISLTPCLVALNSPYFQES